MEAGISAQQVRTGGRNRWKPIAYSLAAMPFLAIFVMELYSKTPLSVGATDAPSGPSVANRQSGDALDGYAQLSITARCKQRWPSDHSMQLICAHHAEAGLADLARIYIANLSIPSMKAALADCLDTYTTEGTTDFALVGVCARTQELNGRLQTPIPALTDTRQTAGARQVARSRIPPAKRPPAASGSPSRV